MRFRKTFRAIAIDGPAGSGKSTVSRLLAQALGFVYIDTGAMYRALTLKVLESNISFDDCEAITEISANIDLKLAPPASESDSVQVMLDSRDVSEKIRTMEVTKNVKYVAKIPRVRENMVKLQRQMISRLSGAVMEGRDIGTVVLPRAAHKFYLDASFAERVRRRLEELRKKGQPVSPDEVADDLKQRDHTDKTRKVGPLKKAKDAVFVDTTGLSIDEVVKTILDLTGRSNFQVSVSPKSTVLYFVSRFTFMVLIRMLFKVRIKGRENFPEPPFIVTSNHFSLLDPPLVGMVCWRYPVDFMAKRELFDAPVIGHWIRGVNGIEVRRGESGIKGLKEAIRRLRKGHVVGVFPEGSRSSEGKLRDAKRGIGFLVARAGVPVVPVYISGTDKAFPKGKGIRPGTNIDVVVGEPILPHMLASRKDSGKEDYAAIADAVMNRIARLK